MLYFESFIGLPPLDDEYVDGSDCEDGAGHFPVSRTKRVLLRIDCNG
jgi:hypothetical protein